MTDFEQRTTCDRETTPDVTEEMDKLLGEDEGALAMVAPYRPEQVSPNRSVPAQISVTEELKVQDAIRCLNERGVDDLHLLINSMGGEVSSSFKIAQALSRNFENITVYVPHIAVSGGTLICLVGDRIVMGDMSNLSPIDPQITRDGKRRSVNSLTRVFQSLESYFSDTAARDAPYPWKALADQIKPVEFQEHIDSSSMMFSHAQTILQNHDELSEPEVNKIIQRLTTEYPTHSYAITYPEAKDIFEGLLIHRNKSEVMGVMETWMNEHVADGSSDHHVLYYTSEKDDNTGDNRSTETEE